MATKNIGFEPASIRSGVVRAGAGLRIDVTLPPLRDERAAISVVFYQTPLDGYEGMGRRHKMPATGFDKRVWLEDSIFESLLIVTCLGGMNNSHRLPFCMELVDNDRT